MRKDRKTVKRQTGMAAMMAERARRAEAYPRLVAALRLGRGAEDHLARQSLLRELGELQ